MHLPTRVTLDQSGALQLLEVVREGGGADLVRVVQGAAGQGWVGAADLLKDLMAARLGERARDLRELLVG